MGAVGMRRTPRSVAPRHNPRASAAGHLGSGPNPLPQTRPDSAPIAPYPSERLALKNPRIRVEIGPYSGFAVPICKQEVAGSIPAGSTD